MAESPGRAARTALFVFLALGASNAIGAYWIAHPDRWWLSQFLMWTPAVAGLTVQALRREPPRTMGFRFTGAGPWIGALLYPLLVIGACVALGYAIGAISGRDVIHFQPETARRTVWGIDAAGGELLLLWAARLPVLLIPWLVVALAYRYELPERLGPGRHAARAALWAGLFWFWPGPWWVPPGVIGEELGWRGWLVRTWRDRPLVALAISAPVWAAFHVPVILLQPPLQSFVPAAAFLLSVASAAAAFAALYLWSGSVWPPAIAHLTWNYWNPLLLGNQYGGGSSVFGGKLWLINGEGLLGMIVNGMVTVAFIVWFRRRRTAYQLETQS